MQILIIGSGGREHALAWKVAQSPKVKRIFVAPGNPGTAQENKVENIKIAVDDLNTLVSFAQNQSIDLTIVGPEIPLVIGIVDQFQSAGLAIFGPTQAASQLEGSKAFSKDFLMRHQIPTAAYQCFEALEPALTYVRQKGAPIVIKADGLAAGKGVIVAKTLIEAEQAIQNMLTGNRFGQAGHRVIIEEFLVGEEVSFIVMADGKHVLPMATSQDHKQVGEGDIGPNTGGMGAYSPAPLITPQIHQRIMKEIILPTVSGMHDEGHPYTGFLYAGLMIMPNGDAKVIEFNCRMGDPEAQPIMMRLQSDLVTLCQAALSKKLAQTQCQWHESAALSVVLAAKGYPDVFTKGAEILGLTTSLPDSQKIFHAGTKKANDRILTDGGRVLCVTALGQSVAQAQQQAYQMINSIQCDNLFYRTDIGEKAIRREIQS